MFFGVRDFFDPRRPVQTMDRSSGKDHRCAQGNGVFFLFCFTQNMVAGYFAGVLKHVGRAGAQVARKDPLKNSPSVPLAGQAGPRALEKYGHHPALNPPNVQERSSVGALSAAPPVPPSTLAKGAKGTTSDAIDAAKDQNKRNGWSTGSYVSHAGTAAGAFGLAKSSSSTGKAAAVMGAGGAGYAVADNLEGEQSMGSMGTSIKSGMDYLLYFLFALLIMFLIGGGMMIAMK